MVRSKLQAMCFFVSTLLILFLILGCGEKEKETSSEVEEEWSEFESSTGDTQKTKPESQPTAQEVEQEVVQNQNFTSQPTRSGYVSAICLNVRNGAGSGSTVVGHVFKGDRLDIFETQNGWARISDAAGYVSGWVSSAYLSDSPVESDFIIPESYKAPKTPTVIEGISAKYVGVARCKNCHSKPHAGFAMGPYGVWRDHFHSSAFETLTKPYSKAFAVKRGISDPVNDWRCRKCHATAYGLPAEQLAPSYSDEEGVGCEACHGPGSEYLIPHTDPNYDEAKLEAMGFRVFSDLQERDRMCRACHNKLSPTYKPFNVEAFSEAIRHWEKEYSFAVSDPMEKPVVKKPKLVKQKPQPVKSEKEIAAAVKPPPPPKKTATKSPPKAPPGDARLAGIANDWMLDKNGPKRGPVFFPHLKHIEEYVVTGREEEVCQVCHHKTKAGAQPGNCSGSGCHKFEVTTVASREKAFHGNCRACHRAEGAGPQKCSECHN